MNVVTDSTDRIKIVTMSCVKPRSQVYRMLVMSFVGPFPIKMCQHSNKDHVKRFSNGCFASASVHCLVTVGPSVGSHSGEFGRCRDRFGRFLPSERYKSDQNQTENGLIGTNSSEND